MQLRELLLECLTEEEVSRVPSSYDIVGDIMIFSDFPEELTKKEALIAKCFLKAFKHIKVVCKKTRKYSGVFRTPKLKILAGERRKQTIHKENGCVIRLDIERCYFSARLASERLRIAQLVKPGELILVMFSGVAVYPLVIARNAKPRHIVAIEKNPVAHSYAKQNLALNKSSVIELIKGDVKRVVPKLSGKFDRVLMPLPKGAETFLNLAIPKVKRNGFLHFYDFADQKSLGDSAKKVEEACKKLKRKCKIKSIVKCGQYSPKVFRVCVDAKLNL